MAKEFYNIWIILVLSAFFSTNLNFSNKPDLNFETHLAAHITSEIKSSNSPSSQNSIQQGPITAVAVPTFAIICNSDELQINASGGSNYVWISNPGNPSGGGLSAYNISNPVFSNGFPGSIYVYDVVVTDTLFPGFSDTERVIISVRNNPMISILPAPDIFVCEREDVYLTASGAMTYRWEDATTGDSLGTGGVFHGNPSTTTTYRVIGTDTNGCWEINELSIFVEEINAFANAATNAVCAGDAVLLTGGSGNQLTWSENGNIIGSGSNIYVTPTVATTYDLMIQNTSGCQDTASVSVEYYDLPVVLNPIDNLFGCGGDELTIGIQINQVIESYGFTGSGTYDNAEIHGNLLTFDVNSFEDTAGFSVTLVGQNGPCSVVESFEILPCSCVPPTISGYSITESKCGGRDGEATLHLENEGAFIYSWTPDLGISQGAGNSREELPSGEYIVEIIDTSNISCSVLFDLIITNANGLEASSVVSPASCSLSNGTAAFTPASYVYLWEDAVESSSRNDLPAGNYFVTVTDPLNPACSNVINIAIMEETQHSAAVTVRDLPDCGLNNGSVSIHAFSGSGNYSFIWQDGLTTSDSIRDNLSSGTYEVVIDDNSFPGCEVALQFVLLDSIGTAVINVLDVFDATCHGIADGRIDFTIDFDSSFDLDADTIITDGQFIYKNGNLPVGEYCLYLLDGNGCFIDYNCFEINEPEALDLSFKIEADCGLGGSIDLTASGGSGSYDYIWSDIPGILGIEDRSDLPAGTYAVTVTDFRGCTIFNDVILVPSCFVTCDYFGGLDSLGFDLESCFIIREYCFSTPISNLANCLIYDNETLYTGTLASCNNDSVSGGYSLEFKPGYHEILIVDTLNDCYDRLFVDVRCTNSGAVCINEVKEFCVTLSDLNLTGAAVTMTNLCPDTTDQRVVFEFDYDNLCVRYEGKSTGLEIACVEVCDILGICETFELRVTVENCLLSTPDFVKDTVFINESITYCPDTSELAGPVVSIDNFCPQQSGDFVDFFLDQSTFCVEYTGLELGVDTACIEICDNFGFCDTTYICVFVEEYLAPPVAVDDCDTTNMGTPVVIDILANDTLYGRITSTKLITDPMWGTAIVNLDRSITYNASDEFCERIDSFHYEVCTETGCDTASVCVWISCVDVFVFTAVSANKDGINDVFYIAGIEDYPQSILRIFNRWGNLVYEKTNYQNTWSGTYNSSTDLPDGTYFYLLELNDEENRVLRGFLELFR